MTLARAGAALFSFRLSGIASAVPYQQENSMKQRMFVSIWTLSPNVEVASAALGMEVNRVRRIATRLRRLGVQLKRMTTQCRVPRMADLDFNVN